MTSMCVYVCMFESVLVWESVVLRMCVYVCMFETVLVWESVVLSSQTSCGAVSDCACVCARRVC